MNWPIASNGVKPSSSSKLQPSRHSSRHVVYFGMKLRNENKYVSSNYAGYFSGGSNDGGIRDALYRSKFFHLKVGWRTPFWSWHALRYQVSSTKLVTKRWLLDPNTEMKVGINFYSECSSNLTNHCLTSMEPS